MPTSDELNKTSTVKSKIVPMVVPVSAKGDKSTGVFQSKNKQTMHQRNKRRSPTRPRMVPEAIYEQDELMGIRINNEQRGRRDKEIDEIEQSFNECINGKEDSLQKQQREEVSPHLFNQD